MKIKDIIHPNPRKIANQIGMTGHQYDNWIYQKDQKALKEAYQLDEGLIQSQKAKLVIKKLQTKFSVKYNEGSISVAFSHTQLKNNFEDLQKLMNNFGWFLASIIDEKYNKQKPDKIYDIEFQNYIFLIFEPKYDLLYDGHITTFYHVSPTRFREKILAKGLIPKSGSKQSYHPERVYLAFSTKNIEALLQDPQMTANYVAFNKPQEDTWDMYSVDTNDLEYLRLYHDPNFAMGKKSLGVYALSGIPPNKLKLVKTF